jgi:exopolysaccharide biosynthesis protein
MRALGASDALNLDGGGSTTMVVDGRVVNHPSDKEGERAVANVLLLLGRKGVRG